MRKLLLLTTLATATSVSAQTIYQCRDLARRVTLQDSPCPENATTELARKSIGQRNAEYRAEPVSIFDPNAQPRLASSIVCPSLRQSYQHALENSQREMLSSNPTQIQRASEAVQHAGAQMSKYRCE